MAAELFGPKYILESFYSFNGTKACGAFPTYYFKQREKEIYIGKLNPRVQNKRKHTDEGMGDLFQHSRHCCIKGVEYIRIS